MEARALLAVDQQKEAVAEAARLGPATQRLIKQTRQLQGQVFNFMQIYNTFQYGSYLHTK